MVDFVNGVSIPIADGDYKNFADAAFKLGVRVGVVFYVLPRLRHRARGASSTSSR